MKEIITLLAGLNPVLNYTSRYQLACISEAMLAMSGRVTMLGLYQRTSKGGSYRTIQRFFKTSFNWPLIRWLLIRHHLQEEDDTLLIAGDEVNVTKSGKQTYGVGRFFSSLAGKTVPSIYFLSLSLISVKNRRSFPLMMEQVMPDMVKSTDKSRSKNSKSQTGKPGRPRGSQNQNRTLVELSKYWKGVQATVKSLLDIVNSSKIRLVYLVFDGSFGNNDALQMVKQCGLHLISFSAL